jgi:ABC-type lipoprotein export system ATPase subunit
MHPLLSLEGVSKSYWRGLRKLCVLTDASFEVNGGELVTIWGQRRSGKTTLLKLAAGLETPTSGVVRFDRRDLAELSPAQQARVLATKIGWTKPTGPDSRELTMLDYVALPLLRKHNHREAHRQAALALDRVGMAGCAGEPWGYLADSERTLVAIAHAIVRAPQLLLVDEHTTHLDDLEREELMGLLRSLADELGMAVLVMVADMSERVHAHQKLTLSSGRVLESSTLPSEAWGKVLDFPGQGARGGGQSA